MGIFKASIFCIFHVLFVLCCGKQAVNTDIPKSVSLLTPEDSNPSSESMDTKWNAFINYIGLPKLYQPTLSELKESLSVPPKASISQLMPENYNAIRTGIATSLIEQAADTQCDASTVEFSKYNRSFVIESDGKTNELLSQSYLMRYKTYKKGESGNAYQYAFLTLPDDESGLKTFPLAVYGRASDNGFLLNEVLTLGEAYHKDYIIVAPAYPGDTIWNVGCPTRGHSSCTVEYKSEIKENAFEGDAFSHLSAQNCLTKIQNTETIKFFGSTSDVLANPFKAKVETHGGVAKAISLGMDRGGLSAQLSVAYSGLFIANGLGTPNSSLSEAFKNQNNVDFVPNLISAIGVIGAPSSFLMASYRVGLENAFKGQLALTPFKKVPGFLAIENMFSHMRSVSHEQLESAVKEASVEIAKRDMLFMGGFMGVGLQNWTKKLAPTPVVAPGAAAYFHGTQDVVVSYDQAKVSYSVATEFHKAVDSGALPNVPGFSYNVFSFQPVEDDLYECRTTKCLKSNLLQHADATFMNSIFVSNFSDADRGAREQPQTNDDALSLGIFGEMGSNSVIVGSVRQALYFLTNSVLGTRLAKTTPPLYSGVYTADSNLLLNPITPPAALILWLQTMAKSSLN